MELEINFIKNLKISNKNMSDRILEIREWLIKNVIAVVISRENIEKYGDLIRHIISDDIIMSIWIKCFTHRSISFDNYETLEFFGDGKINSLHIDALFNYDQTLNQEELSNMAGQMRNNINQGKVSKAHNLAEILDVVINIEDLSDAIYSDILETIIGSLYYAVESYVSGLGYAIITLYYNYLYQDYNFDILDKIVAKNVVNKITNIMRIDEITISQYMVKDIILYYAKLSRTQYNVILNIGSVYKRTLNIPLTDADGNEYNITILPDMIQNLKQELINIFDLNNINYIDEIDFNEQEQTFIIPTYLIGFSIESKDDCYHNIKRNFEEIGITMDKMSEYSKFVSVQSFFNKLSDGEELLKSILDKGYKEISFFADRKLNKDKSMISISLIGVDNSNNNYVLHTLTGHISQINEIKENLVRYVKRL